MPPVPKPPDQRRRRNKEERVELPPAPDALAGPDLPPAPDALDGVWPAEVVEWYDDWRRSPMVAMFQPTDWRRLRMIAPLVACYVRTLDPRLMSEIRLNETLLGATATDRAKMKWDTAKPPTPAPVSAQDELADRRKRIIGA
jgi:hypothetical protein